MKTNCDYLHNLHEFVDEEGKFTIESVIKAFKRNQKYMELINTIEPDEVDVSDIFDEIIKMK